MERDTERENMQRKIYYALRKKVGKKKWGKWESIDGLSSLSNFKNEETLYKKPHLYLISLKHDS